MDSKYNYVVLYSSFILTPVKKRRELGNRGQRQIPTDGPLKTLV